MSLIGLGVQIFFPEEPAQICRSESTMSCLWIAILMSVDAVLSLHIFHSTSSDCLDHWSYPREPLWCGSQAPGCSAQTHGRTKCEVWLLSFLIWLTSTSSSYIIGGSKIHEWKYLRVLLFFKSGFDSVGNHLAKMPRQRFLAYVGM